MHNPTIIITANDDTNKYNVKCQDCNQIESFPFEDWDKMTEALDNHFSGAAH